ncbi:MAG: hydroxymethylglutaryl-CoA reductase, degradative [Caldilineaceae bacterium]|nr:hydroxymethylglutaryl-CoA reductase, degradative [Caldilineaceae bacterium]
MTQSSRLSGFYQKSVAERVAIVARWADLTPEEVNVLHNGLSVAQADKMVENVVGRYTLPLGIGANFLINGKDYLIPLVVEEPSVVAAVSYAAKLARTGGGFTAGSTEPVMIAQIQLLDTPDMGAAEAAILAARAELLALADTSPSITERGGGPVDIEVRQLPVTPTVPMLIVHLLFDTRDAMGANAINTAAEAIAPALERLSGGRALLRILSNLSDRRRAWAEVTIPAAAFSTIDFAGADVIEGIAHANAFAVADPYRAATHNKGILNGIDAVALATGNDWRAIEAGAHAYAARDGQYRALTDWQVVSATNASNVIRHASSGTRTSQFTIDNSQFTIESEVTGEGQGALDAESSLYGRLELPLAVGTVGGATRAHPAAQVALKILGITAARELAEVMAAVGLAQNLAAIRALATEGIQRGHMALHARQVAVAAGAQGEEVDRIAARLIADGQIRVERARELLG